MSRFHKTRLPRKRIITLLMLWLVIGSLVVGFAGAAIMMTRRPADATALCQRSALAAAATTAIIVDGSDRLTKDQRQRLKTTIEVERDQLVRGGRLIILSLNPATPWQPTQLIAVCNPGKAADANPLFVTRSKIAKRWRHAFADPIARAIQKASEQSGSKRSPIIITVAATLTRADFDRRVAARRLVIISDLLEHDKRFYSQLGGGNFWRRYQRSALHKRARLDLGGVTVAIDYLQRGKYASLQGPRHQAFWQRLLTEAGAREVHFLGIAQAKPARDISRPADTPHKRRAAR